MSYTLRQKGNKMERNNNRVNYDKQPAIDDLSLGEIFSDMSISELEDFISKAKERIETLEHERQLHTEKFGRAITEIVVAQDIKRLKEQGYRGKVVGDYYYDYDDTAENYGAYVDTKDYDEKE